MHGAIIILQEVVQDQRYVAEKEVVVAPLAKGMVNPIRDYGVIRYWLISSYQ